MVATTLSVIPARPATELATTERTAALVLTRLSIPDGEIERLKKEVSLERLVTAFGIELRRHGVDLLGPVSVTTASRRW
jgi:hypothetical protein